MTTQYLAVLFLHVLSKSSNIYDGRKKANRFDKCNARVVHFTVVSGRKGASERLLTEINKAGAILVKQVVRYLFYLFIYLHFIYS